MESLPRCQDEPAPAPAESAGAAAPLSVPDRVRQALIVLLQAYRYAEDLDLDSWDFAVELPTLRPLGLTNSDCRWLIGRGWVECGFELTLAGDERRSFRRSTNLKLSKRSCLVLTDSGVLAAGGKPSESSTVDLTEPSCSNIATTKHRPVSFPEIIASAASESKPVWDRDRQQLRVGKVIVKQFKVPAANQEA
ncbi:MAG TPA: hypothetical protein VKB78_05160, partial [Pirellulales bacterium]|nr:hypothetical protein [Pirellulales bacterium]